MSTKRKGVLDDEVLRLESQLHQVQRDKEELRNKLQECVDINLKLEKSRDELGDMLNDRLNILFHVPLLIELFTKFGKETHAIEKFWFWFGQMTAAQERLDHKQARRLQEATSKSPWAKENEPEVKVEWDKSTTRVLLKDEEKR